MNKIPNNNSIIKEKIDTFYHIKIKNFYLPKDIRRRKGKENHKIRVNICNNISRCSQIGQVIQMS